MTGRKTGYKPEWAVAPRGSTQSLPEKKGHGQRFRRRTSRRGKYVGQQRPLGQRQKERANLRPDLWKGHHTTWGKPSPFKGEAFEVSRSGKSANTPRLLFNFEGRDMRSAPAMRG